MSNLLISFMAKASSNYSSAPIDFTNTVTIAWIACLGLAVALLLVALFFERKVFGILAFLFAIAGTVLGFIDNLQLNALFWLVFTIVAAVNYFLYFYVEKQRAKAFLIAALVSIAVSPIDYTYFIPGEWVITLNFAVPFVVFILVALPIAIINPKVTRVRKRKVIPNVTSASILKKTLTVTKEASIVSPGRASYNDIDWAIIPLKENEILTVGQRVVVVKMVGVTLVCEEAEEAKIRRIKEAKAAQEAKRAAEKEAAKSEKLKKIEAKTQEAKNKFDEKMAIRKAKEEYKATLKKEKLERKLEEIKLKKSIDEERLKAKNGAKNKNNVAPDCDQNSQEAPSAGADTNAKPSPKDKKELKRLQREEKEKAKIEKELSEMRKYVESVKATKAKWEEKKALRAEKKKAKNAAANSNEPDPSEGEVTPEAVTPEDVPGFYDTEE